MSYSAAAGRAQLLSELFTAGERIGMAVATLGEVYEWLDDQSADRLEEELFRPAQRALGRVRRAYTEFGARYEVPMRELTPAPPSGRPGDSRGAIERAADSLRTADETLATLQDSMLPVEVGDPELRRALAEVRELISPVPGRAAALLRVLGR